MDARKQQEALNRFQYVCEDTDNKDRMKRYNAVAKFYDKDSEVLDWMGPQIAAEAVAKYFYDKQIRILDVCAGTGAVANELNKLGFRLIDFLDGSTEMAKIAMDQNLYSTYICQIIGETEETIIKDALYDAVIMSGGHVSPAKCKEMLRLAKSGGYCFLVVFLESEFDEKEYSDTLDHVKNGEADGKCRLISSEKIDKVSLDEKGAAIAGALVVWQKC